jgi:hypothetical protein
MSALSSIVWSGRLLRYLRIFLIYIEGNYMALSKFEQTIHKKRYVPTELRSKIFWSAV